MLQLTKWMKAYGDENTRGSSSSRHCTDTGVGNYHPHFHLLSEMFCYLFFFFKKMMKSNFAEPKF